MLSTRKTLAVIVSSLFGLAMVGCGGSSSHTTSSSSSTPSTSSSSSASSGAVSASSYVSAVCTAVIPFQKDVQQRSSALDVSSTATPAEGKKALQGFMSAAVSDADKAVTQLKSAGSPNVANGSAISAGLVSAFSQLKQVLAKAETDTNQLPTTSPAAFKSAADAISTSVKTSVGAIGGSLTGLKSPELEKAATSAPACKSLGS